MGIPINVELPQFTRTVIWGSRATMEAAMETAKAIGARIEHAPTRCNGHACAATVVVESRVAGALRSRLGRLGANCETSRTKMPVLALLRQAILLAAASSPGSSAESIVAAAAEDFSRSYRIAPERLLASMRAVLTDLSDAGRLTKRGFGWDCNPSTDPGPHRMGRASRATRDRA